MGRANIKVNQPLRIGPTANFSIHTEAEIDIKVQYKIDYQHVLAVTPQTQQFTESTSSTAWAAESAPRTALALSLSLSSVYVCVCARLCARVSLSAFPQCKKTVFYTHHYIYIYRTKEWP